MPSHVIPAEIGRDICAAQAVRLPLEPPALLAEVANVTFILSPQGAVEVEAETHPQVLLRVTLRNALHLNLRIALRTGQKVALTIAARIYPQVLHRFALRLAAETARRTTDGVQLQPPIRAPLRTTS